MRRPTNQNVYHVDVILLIFPTIVPIILKHAQTFYLSAPRIFLSPRPTFSEDKCKPAAFITFNNKLYAIFIIQLRKENYDDTFINAPFIKAAAKVFASGYS